VRVKHLVAASAASGILAFGLAPDASAAPSSVVVQPHIVAPGGQVSVFGNDCTSDTGRATSSVFTAPIQLSMLSNSLGGVGTVSTKARPGTWKVFVTCGGKHFTGLVSVCKCGGKPSPSPSASPSTEPSTSPSSSPSAAAPSATARPRGGAATGDGASQAAAGSGLTALGSGAVLTVAGLGLGAVAVRRRRNGAQR
jgi:hypothetical protein